MHLTVKSPWGAAECTMLFIVLPRLENLVIMGELIVREVLGIVVKELFTAVM